MVPATYWWTGATSSAWNAAGNWAANADGTGAGAVPGAGDNAVFNASSHVVNQINSFGADVTVNSVLFNSSLAISVGISNSLTIIGDPTLNGGTFADGTSTDALALGTASNSVSISGQVNSGTATSGQTETWINNSSAKTFSASIVGFNNQITFAGVTTAPMVVGQAPTGATGAGLVVNGTWLESSSLAGLRAAGPLTFSSGKFSAAGSSQVSLNNPVTINGNFTVGDPSNFGCTFVGPTTILGSNDSIQLSATCTFSGGLTLPTADSNTTFSGSTLQSFSGALSLGGMTHTLTLNTGTASVNLTDTITGAGLASAGTLILAGSGTGVVIGPIGIASTLPATPSNASIVVDSTTGGAFGFTGAGTYSGGTTLLAGTLGIKSDTTVTSALPGSVVTAGPLGVGPIMVSGGTLSSSIGSTLGNGLTINGDATIGASGFVLSGNTTFAPGLATLTTIGGTSFSGNVSIDDDFAVAGTLSGNLVFGSPGSAIFLNAPHTLRFDDSGAPAFNGLSGELDNGSNTLTLATDLLITPNVEFVTLAGAGNLAIGANLTVKNDNPANTIDGGLSFLAATAKFDLNGLNFTIDSISGSGSIGNSSISVATIAVGLHNANSTFLGDIGGFGNVADLALYKLGAGTLTLTSTNLYTGGTKVGGGTLALVFPTTTAKNLIPATSALTLFGGDLKLIPDGAAANTQTFASITFAAGASTIDASAFSNTAAALSLTTVTRLTDATVNILVPAPGLGSVVAPLSFWGFWTYVNGSDFASPSSGLVVPQNAAIKDDETTWTNSGNFSFDTSISLTANRSVGTLRYVGTGAATIDLGSRNLSAFAILNAGGGPPHDQGQRRRFDPTDQRPGFRSLSRRQQHRRRQLRSPAATRPPASSSPARRRSPSPQPAPPTRPCRSTSTPARSSLEERTSSPPRLLVPSGRSISTAATPRSILPANRW